MIIALIIQCGFISDLVFPVIHMRLSIQIIISHGSVELSSSSYAEFMPDLHTGRRTATARGTCLWYCQWNPCWGAERRQQGFQWKTLQQPQGFGSAKSYQHVSLPAAQAHHSSSKRPIVPRCRPARVPGVTDTELPAAFHQCKWGHASLQQVSSSSWNRGGKVAIT